jgi:Tol biopolymer transport system component
LNRVGASPGFATSPRLRKFLYFVVERTLDGRAEDLKETVVGVEVFGRDASYDPRIDPVVRITAGRVRERLEQYYQAEGQLDDIRIALPKGGYVPRFEQNHRVIAAQDQSPAVTIAEQPTPPVPSGWWKPGRLGGAALLAMACVAAFWFALSRDSRPPMQLVPLVSELYDEGAPSLSPDGTMVAFRCVSPLGPGTGGGGTDICVKGIGTEVVRRLFETPESESNPAWSPDGREIAFVRARKGIFSVSHLGGPERQLSDSGTHVGWMPDGKSILIRDEGSERTFGIYRIDLDTKRKRRLTFPPYGVGDFTFAASPDLRSLAFVRSERPGIMDLYVVPIEGGTPRRLTDWNAVVSDVVWTADSRELIYSAVGRLWRIPAYGTRIRRGSLLADIPATVDRISISRRGANGTVRIAFRTFHREDVMRLIDLEAPLVDGKLQTGAPIAASTRIDVPNAFSPDGNTIAFTSTRASMTGADAWIVNLDGTGLRRITSLDAPELVVGSWSPDGKSIALDASIAGNGDIYVVSTQGEKPIRLTFAPDLEGLPAWSADSRWIYFASSATGPIPEIWRVPANGGPSERVTRGGGFEPRFPPDGKYLYYLLDRPSEGAGNPSRVSKLLRMPIAGGDPIVIHDRVPAAYWSISNKGIYFLTSDGPTPNVYVDLYRFIDERIVRVGELPFHVSTAPGQFVVSPDGRRALASETTRNDIDLMLLENFR